MGRLLQSSVAPEKMDGATEGCFHFNCRTAAGTRFRKPRGVGAPPGGRAGAQRIKEEA